MIASPLAVRRDDADSYAIISPFHCPAAGVLTSLGQICTRVVESTVDDIATTHGGAYLKLPINQSCYLRLAPLIAEIVAATAQTSARELTVSFRRECSPGSHRQ